MMKLLIVARTEQLGTNGRGRFVVTFVLRNQTDGWTALQCAEFNVEVTLEQYRLLVPGRELSVEALDGLRTLAERAGIPGDSLAGAPDAEAIRRLERAKARALAQGVTLEADGRHIHPEPPYKNGFHPAHCPLCFPDNT